MAVEDSFVGEARASVRAGKRGTMKLWALVAAAVLLAGCDVKTKVTLGTHTSEEAATTGRLAQLESEALAQRERADRLQGEVEDLQETSIVLAGDDGVVLRLNTQAAVVLVIAILAIAAVLIARMKYASRRN